MMLVKLVLLLCIIYTAVSENNYFKGNNTESELTSSCYCTTVPCPVVGANYLTEGNN